MKNRIRDIVASLERDGSYMVTLGVLRTFYVKRYGDHWLVTSPSAYLESKLARSVFMSRDGAIIACVLVLLDEI